jgi:hypothetical protein
MTFFNQKEEVIQIELTQYGKHLLSRGKLKPAYYAFFDDDIIYDGKYSQIEETSAEAVERIKSSPRIKTQYVFSGLEEETKKNLNIIKNNKLQDFNISTQAEKHYVLTQRIGNSFLGDKKIPSFSVIALNGEINKTTILQTGSMPNLKIPSLELKDSEYKISAINSDTSSKIFNAVNTPVTFDDGTSIYIKDDYIMLEILEENVEDEMKNFDIELFMVQEDQDNNEIYVPLNFDQKFEDFKNGILLDPPEVSQEDNEYYAALKEQDQYRAQNYFNILVDNEIEKNLICELINNMRTKASSLYDPQYDCEEYVSEQQQPQQNAGSLYDPSFDENDIKKC